MIAVGRDWKRKCARPMAEIAALKADLNKGLTDLAEGRVKDFEVGRIVELGKKLLD
jgi:antitoxin ParD1/3/4